MEPSSILNEVLQVIRRQEADIVIYTDGSMASDGMRNVSAAVVVSQGDPALPEVICTERHRGSAYTSSFEEEREAMKMALNWLIDRHHSGTVLICTDSQALLRAIDGPKTITVVYLFG